MALNPLISSYNNNNNNFVIKRDFSNGNNMRAEIPPWLHSNDLRGEIFIGSCQDEHPHQNHETLNPNGHGHGHGCGASIGLPPPSSYQCSWVSSPHISATALLQKAAQMGATMSSTTTTSGSMQRPHKMVHVSTGACFYFLLLFCILYCSIILELIFRSCFFFYLFVCLPTRGYGFSKNK